MNPPMTPTSPEQQFKRELDVFDTEAATAKQFFYAWLGIHAAAAESKEVHRVLNTAALFWNTNMGALQTATFVSLGRIFDQNSTHNIDRFLKLAQDNRQIFSKAALAARKQGTDKSPPEWLPEYMYRVYVPKLSDFRRLRAQVNRYRKIYEQKYRDLRRKIFAHEEVSDPEKIAELFAKTNIRELQRLIVFLGRLHDALWEMFMNGRKPSLRPSRYSVKSMRKKPSSHGRSVQERIVHEAERFLADAARSAPKKLRR